MSEHTLEIIFRTISYFVGLAIGYYWGKGNRK